MKIFSEHDVKRLLTYDACIRVMEDALAALARGEVDQPLRSIIRGRGAGGLLGLMPSYDRDYGLKEVCVFSENPKRGLDTHLGAVLLHSGETGELLAMANASAITAIRTASVSAVATKLLARQDASVLAILGAGVQARSHLAAIPLVRTIREVRIYSPNRAKAEEAAKGFAASRVAGSAEEAIRGADIVVTATNAREPVVRREWIAPGAHINAVGSSVATTRELDGATIAAGSLFVDRRESTVNESGDYLFALQEGAIAGPEHIRAEIGEILTLRAKGRTSPGEITIFKSLGLAIEDLASVRYLYETGGGVEVAF